ncbi:MAG: DUF3060 domain-containing protein [Chryseobacterium sp.]|nr:MAG: DUF3060 domain-containing protein [Chryseobacterium sp.]
MLFSATFVSAQNLRGVYKSGAGITTQTQNEVRIEGAGHTKTVTMNGGTLLIEGAGNTITVNGFASKVIISGASNTVNIDKVSSVSIEGAANKIHYRAANTKSSKPAVSVSGAGSSVQRTK